MIRLIENIKIKESYIYYFLVFWVYGFYGIATDNSSKISNIYLILPLIPFIVIYFINKKNENILILNNLFLNLNIKKNLKYFFIITISLFYLSYEKITLSITNDEYAYVSLGLTHSNLIISKFIYLFEPLSEFKVKYLYQIISLNLVFFIFIYTCTSIYLIGKYRNLNIIIFSFIILFLRYIITLNGGNPFAHPPLIGLPSLISVSFFGLSDLILKLTYFTIYLFFSFYIFIKLTEKFNKIISLIIIISLFSLPGILYLGISYEQALISLICFTFVLIEVVEEKEIDYKKIFIIILFFSFFRILSLLSLSIIFFYIIFKSKTLKGFFSETLIAIKNSYPLLLIIPFLIFSFLQKSTITVDRLGFDFLTINVFIKDLFLMIFNSYSFYGGILIIFTLFFYIINRFKILILFLGVLLIIYSNVIPNNSKYLYEIFFPILIYFFLNLKKIVKINFIKNFFIFTVILVLPINIIYLKNFSKLCLIDDNPLNENNIYDVRFGCLFHDTHPINLKSPYKFLNSIENFSFENLYVPGVYYGLLPSIINGMNISEYKQHRKVNKNQNALNIKNNILWISADPKLIHEDENIKYLLLADVANYKFIKKSLINLGWKLIYEKNNKKFHTKTSILYRNN